MKRALSLIALAALTGCGDPDLNCDFPPTTVTLEGSLQANLFDKSCKSCHFKDYAYGDFSSAAMTAANTAGKTSAYSLPATPIKVVEPKNLANSVLWLKVLGGTASGRGGPHGEAIGAAMPNDGAMLSANVKKELKAWICSGALEK